MTERLADLLASHYRVHLMCLCLCVRIVHILCMFHLSFYSFPWQRFNAFFPFSSLFVCNSSFDCNFHNFILFVFIAINLHREPITFMHIVNLMMILAFFSPPRSIWTAYKRWCDTIYKSSGCIFGTLYSLLVLCLFMSVHCALRWCYE